MALSSTTKVLIAGGVAVAALIGVAAAAGTSSSSTPAPGPHPAPGPTPTPPAGPPASFQAGERYAVTLTTPLAVPAMTVDQMQHAIDAVAPGAFRVVQASPAFNAPATTAVYTIDALQTVAPQWLTQLWPNPTLVAYSIQDLGPTPVGATAPPATSPGPLPTPRAQPPPVGPPPAPSPADVQIAANRAALQAGVAIWQTGGTVGALDRGRVTIADADYRRVAPPGFGPGGRNGFGTWVSQAATLLGPAYFVWAPGDALPPDWPADDPNADTGWHFEWVSQNASAQIGAGDLTSALGVPLTLWVAPQGRGPAMQTRPGVLTWRTTDAVNPSGSAGGQINPGDHVRLTLASADIVTIASAVGQFAMRPSCGVLLSLAAFTGFDALVTGGSAQVLAWCGMNWIPPDWPPEDDLTQYHLEFRYTGGSPLVVAGLPFPVLGAWIGQGAGA